MKKQINKKDGNTDEGKVKQTCSSIVDQNVNWYEFGKSTYNTHKNNLEYLCVWAFYFFLEITIER